MATGLYDNGYIVNYVEGDQSLQTNPGKFTGYVGNRYHSIVEGETLLDISRKYYGTSYSWYLIADANLAIIEDIFNLPVAELLLIPIKVMVV